MSARRSPGRIAPGSLPGHLKADLERALRIPALSPGWRGSFQALLDQDVRSGGAPAGNAGLAPPSGPPPAWPGFRSLRISRIARESGSVVSLGLVSGSITYGPEPLDPPATGILLVCCSRPTGDVVIDL